MILSLILTTTCISMNIYWLFVFYTFVEVCAGLQLFCLSKARDYILCIHDRVFKFGIHDSCAKTMTQP